MTEIELKLALSPDDVAAFRRAAPLAGIKAKRRKLTSIYFDTPGCELQEAGMALRLRKASGKWTQTLKGGASGTGGLHARGEWESARPDATIDLAPLQGTMLDAVKDREHMGERLKPAFTVEFERETWDVEPVPGTRVEVALDRGAAHAGDRADRVCEVEIELLEGDRGAAFDFARALVGEVALRPSAITKAQRGYRLFRGEVLQPARARRVRLDATMTAREAARAVAGAALDQLQANEEGVLGTTDPEFVHQARVGLRRMRSALRIFGGVLPADAKRWRDECAGIAAALGEARDWDVFATETLPPLAKAFGQSALARSLTQRVALRRRRSREAARAALRDPDYARLVLDIARWLSDDHAELALQPGDPLADFASRLIRKRHHRLIADATHLASLTSAQRHAVRIDAKRLRYCADGFASLFKERRVDAYLDTLSQLQDRLGTSNDAATAAKLLAELAPPTAFADFARGWLAARVEGDPAQVDALVDRLRNAKRFWRKNNPTPKAP